MAGTPDKSGSGEHKASGGPTPDERDPRLAVSRDSTSTSAPSGVDQETAVFSAREVRASASGESEGDTPASEEAGDERLRAAVAAWVAGDGPEASADANSGDADSGRDDAAPDDDEAEPAAEADADADAESAEKSDADVESESKPDGAAEPDADAEPDVKSGGDTEPDVKSDGESGSGAGAKRDADAEPGAKSSSDAKSESDADKKADAESGAKPVPGADVEPDAKSSLDAEPESDADAKSGGDAEPDAESSSDAKSEAKSDGDAESDAEPDAKSGATPEPGADAKPDAKSSSGAKSESDGDAKSKPDAKSDADAESDVESSHGAKSGAKPDGGAKSDGGSDADAKADAKPDADAKADAKADAESGSGGVPEAEAAGAKGPVDQPTAVFKAVEAPAVDQPTTTLKAAGTAKSSKFVPLKPLDEETAGGTGKSAGKELPPEAKTGAKTEATAGAEPTVEPAERTTQQPLPPKPPLDLLAELTNTPPPPETRVRTAVRRVKVWTPLVILLIIVFAIVQAVRPLPTPTLSLTTDATYTFDGDKASLPWPDEGQGWMDVQGIGTMDHFGEQQSVPIGSVAKSMTAYIVLKDHPLKKGEDGPKITVDATAEKEGGYDADGQNESTLNTVKEGDKLSEKDALAAVMIPSANNIARLLARWDAGSEEAFVKKMNDTAKELGMKNTKYTDPSGLKESTVSTAEDQVKLGNELVQIPALTDITKLPTWTDPSGKKWTNYNRLVPYDGAVGIKTGTTTKAGGNLLFAATKDAGGSTVTVVGAVLGQHKAPIIDTVNAVSKTAMLAAQDEVTSSTILKKGDVVGYVDDQLGGHTPVTVTEDVKAVGWAGKTVHLQLADQNGKSVPHTGKTGDKVGVLEVGDGEGGAVEVPVALQKDLAEPGFGAKLTRVG
ncbi:MULTISPECIES: D-alanyl-D-alanine carboxypeptidase [unclassified Streptomyces]|uniref:D-alanyl-D-alanine carboxypeptidase n=1 Tax=unclassified Streptomyces TaxID=2593676 RepID=UPI00278C2F21|nr:MULTISPECIES: D-alanyl-D-alanine carboxypeptidase [unclassified Streptomyces]